MRLGERVRKAREYAGLGTQEDLVKRIVLLYGEKSAPKQQTISRIESNKAATTEFIVKIAVACNVSPWWLDSETGPMTLDKGLTVEIPRVSVNILTDAIALTLETFQKRKHKPSPRDIARTAAQLYSFTRPNGSLDPERVLTVITAGDRPAKEHIHGDERRGKRNTKKDSRRRDE